MKYEYQAIDDEGNVIRGVIEASTIEKAFRILLYKGFRPLDLKPLTKSTEELSRLYNLKFKLEGKSVNDSDDIGKSKINRLNKLQYKYNIDFMFYTMALIVIVAILCVFIIK